VPRAAGEGKEAIARMFKVERKQLGSWEAQGHSDAEPGMMISDGAGRMKPVELAAQQTADVIAWVRTLMN
jgi:hypothetical protein